MRSIEEIEAAVSNLNSDDYRRFADWFREHDQKLWDEQIDRDSESGRLDSLFEEAERELADGSVREWPAAK